MDVDQAFSAVLGGIPTAFAVGAALKVVWGKYQDALTDREELHAMIRDRDQAELEAWRQMATSRPGESSDGE